MKKIFLTFCTILLIIIFSGCSKAPEENKIDKIDIDAQTKTQEEAIASLTNPNEESLDSTADNNEDNSGCDWIDESDIIMRLDLPEEYRDRSSYTAGFAHLDNYGSIYRTGRSARSNCDYRVGFNKNDFTNHKGIHIPYAEAGLGFYFIYEDQPLQMILKDGLPDYDGELVLKVTAKVSAADDLSHDILKGQ